MPDLDHDDRMLLFGLACSLAWADWRVQPEERDAVRAMIRSLGASDDERRRVEAWLEEPPPPVDPARVPKEHRMRFTRAVESVVAADARVVPAERERLLQLARAMR